MSLNIACSGTFYLHLDLVFIQVAEKLLYPCKNAYLGCTDTLRLREKDEHEANCAYRTYRCVMVPPCEWKGQHSDILHHVVMSHPDVLLRGSEHVSTRGACDPVEPCFVLFCSCCASFTTSSM